MLPEAVLHDPVFWAYSGIVLVTAYGFALFLWWWHRARKASEVFIYFMILLASESFYNLFNAMSRYLLYNDHDKTDYFSFLGTTFWQSRAFIHLGVLTLIIARMTMRAIKSIREEGKS